MILKGGINLSKGVFFPGNSSKRWFVLIHREIGDMPHESLFPPDIECETCLLNLMCTINVISHISHNELK